MADISNVTTRADWKFPLFVWRMLVLSLAAMLASPLIASTIDPFASSQVRMGPLLYTAQNWSGYAVEANPKSSGTVSGVSGTWIVPTAAPSADPAANSSEPQCAVWVGIDGFGNNTVEQIGTNSYLYGGKPHYYAWYEMYPASMMEIFSYQVAISPGDSITASVQYGLPSYPNEYLLTLTDNTTGKSFSTPQSSTTASRSSAEWIAEAPSGSGFYPLPTVGSVAFSDASATIGGVTGPIDNPAWQEWQINLQDSTWNDAMTPTAVTDSPSASPVSSFTIVQAPEPSTFAILAVASAMFSLRIFRRPRGPSAAPCVKS
jgi:hypothetical protein